MKKPRTSLMICGVSRSGSQALVDLFREYDNVGVFPGELDDFRAAGLIADQLDEKLKKDWPNLIHQRIRIGGRKSKLAYKFLPKDIMERERLYRWLISFKKVDRKIILLMYAYFLKDLNSLLTTDVKLEVKVEKTRQWIQNISKLYCRNNENKRFILFDQPLTINSNLDIWPKVFDPFKLICMVREPKDQFANLIKDGILYKPYGAPNMNWGGNMLESVYGRTKKDAMRLFIDDIKIKYKRIQQFHKVLGEDNFLMLQFEDLVTNYDRIRLVLENFVGELRGNHKYAFTHFKPDVSARNIGFYDRYLSPDEISSLSELQVIYKDLCKNYTSKFIS